MDNKTKWERLEEARKEKGFSQAYCAKMLDISRNAWINWENRIFEPSLDNLLSISKLLNISIDYLLGNDHFGSMSDTDRNTIRECYKKLRDIAERK